MRKIIILIITCLTGLNAIAQNEASNWYFGENAGINFNFFTGEVTSLDNGQINTREGCASISDSNGDLLFYTDGSTVYNKFHEIMPNGEGLLGDESSTQSAIVVPNSNNPNIYYVFTVGSNANDTGLNYSEIDVSANLSTGEVTRKNINLLPDCAEKISAVVKDCDSKSIWVITLSNSSGVFPVNAQPNLDTFYAYEVNAVGVNPVPVKSTLPITISDTRGYLKLSPSGFKLACANVRSGLYLFDFNSTTGTVSNTLPLSVNGSNNFPYGVEFSPDSQFLYILASNDFFDRTNSTNNNNPTNHSANLIQYNLNAANINNSQVVLDSRQQYRGALQLAPNGKIYRSMSQTYDDGLNALGVINNPNELGVAANYQHNAVSLGSNNSTQGLPPFITSFFNQQIDIINNNSSSTFLALCENETYTLVADNLPGAIYSWTRDDIPLPESDFDLLVTQSGRYKVVIEPNGSVITNSCGLPQGVANVQFFDNPNAFNTSIFQCDLDIISDGLTTYNLNNAFQEITDSSFDDVTISFYLDPNDAINNTNPILNPEAFENDHTSQIYARATHTISGCYNTSVVNLEISDTQVSNFIADSVCDELNSEDGINSFVLDDYTPLILNTLTIPTTELVIKYYGNINDAHLEQNAITDYTNTNPYSQKLYFRIENITTNDCFGINELELNISKLPNIEEEEETLYYCLNTFPETITIHANVIGDSPNNYTYNWSTGEDTYEIDINDIGIYTVTITNKATTCSKERTIIIEASNVATFEAIEVVDVTQNNTITTLVSGEGVYEYALENDNGIYRQYQESNIFENVSPGIYTITVRDIKNNCGTVANQVSIIGFPKFFTPNNDGVHDTWQVLGISGMFQPNSNIFIYNRFGKLIKQLNPLGAGWDGTFNGEKLPVDDYWFMVTLQDGRIFKNHFTLKY